MSETLDGAATPTAATQFTVPAVADAVAAALPDREFVIQGERRYTYAQIVERSKRLAGYLHSRGLGCHTERSKLAGHEVGQDLLGIYAYNGNEFVEALLGAFWARVAPFNVNFRYVKNELRYLLADAGASALIYHAAFAPRVAEVLPELPQLRVLIQIADDSGNDLIYGAVDYESVIASSSPTPPPVEPSPDDVYVLYTGGTTGMPKGVLWRQHDIFMTSFGGRNLYTGQPVGSYEEIAARAAAVPATKVMMLSRASHAGEDLSVRLRKAELQASYRSAEHMGFDELIDPRETRDALLGALKRGLHSRQAAPKPVTRTAIVP
jgi:acyl-CoA synthetase (AMP-forming)/AMP-acid ligase II